MRYHKRNFRRNKLLKTNISKGSSRPQIVEQTKIHKQQGSALPKLKANKSEALSN